MAVSPKTYVLKAGLPVYQRRNCGSAWFMRSQSSWTTYHQRVHSLVRLWEPIESVAHSRSGGSRSRRFALSVCFVPSTPLSVGLGKWPHHSLYLVPPLQAQKQWSEPLKPGAKVTSPPCTDLSGLVIATEANMSAEILQLCLLVIALHSFE